MTRNKHHLNIVLLIFVLLLASLQSAGAADKVISVQAQVAKEKVSVGESFLLQIKIDGHDSPAEPDLSSVQDFTVKPKGGGQNNRESISFINGKINRISEHGYVFQYELTPKRDGILTIPALEIRVGGKTLLTQPIPIRVAKPVVTEEFKLRLTLSESESYVGQPLILTVKWYVDRNIAEFTFDLPFFEDNRLTVVDFPEDRGYQGQDAIAVRLPGGTVVGRKGQEGRFATVTVRKIVIPREPGEFSLGQGSVFSKIITGYQQKSPGRPFNDFFDDVFSRRQAVYKQLVTESNSLHLKVLALPEENRPPDFSGLVGVFSLAAEASPTEVNVGDPITIYIMITGSEYLENVILPPLGSQPDIRDNFKVPDEMGPGKIDGRMKVFTQTIRAKKPAVQAIPGISLNYFNPEIGDYESATSKAIPLQVNATKIITAKDAEGVIPGMSKNELTSFNKGIAHNYEGEDVLANRNYETGSWFSSPTGMALILLPPLIFLLVLTPTYFKRKRLQNTDTIEAQKALSGFSKEIAKLQKGIDRSELRQSVNSLVEAMRRYLSKRLFMRPGGLVNAEMAASLQQRGVDDALLNELKRILDWCEAYRYGAIGREASPKENLQDMLAAALVLFKKIDQSLNKLP